MSQEDNAIQKVGPTKQQGKPISKDIICRLLQGAIKKKNLTAGRHSHFLMVSHGLDSIAFLGDHLIRLFALCGSLQEANQVFSRVSNPSVYTWNAIISAHVKLGRSQEALGLYHRMQEKGETPSRVTFLCIIKACSIIFATEQGRLIHDQIVKVGLDSDAIVGNSVVDMYGKCRSLKEAYSVFDKLKNRDMVSWGAIIAGFAQHGEGVAALELFGRMQQGGLKPNNVLFLCTLKACGSIGALEQGRLIHDQAMRTGLESDVIVGSTLVDMYSKCGSLEEARRMFDKMKNRNVVSWGAMIAGYAELGDGFLALEVFKTMKQEGIEPDRVMFSCILKACGSIGAIGQGRLIHNQIITSGLELDLVLGNTLVDMYARCGSLEETCKAFDDLPNRDTASWGAMIAGFARSGNCIRAGQCLKDMLREGLKPGDAIFTSILNACSSAGSLEEGWRYFKDMKAYYGITATIEHYNCIVELLGREGHLKEAEHLLQTMPIPPDITGWTSLLTSCRTYGNVDIGRRCFHQTSHLDLDDASGYMLMSNIFAEANMWEAAEKVQDLRRYMGAPKKPGRVWIEINNNAHGLLVGGQGHPQSDVMSEKLNRLGKEMKDWYVPRLDLVLEYWR